MMGRQRSVDYDAVRAARAEGLTYKQIEERFGISDTWANAICNPDFAKRLDEHAREWTRENKRVECDGGCGTLVWALEVPRADDGLRLCTPCRARARQTRFRRDESDVIVEVRCSTCKKWKVVGEFTSSQDKAEGIHSQCRSCQTAAKRSWRQRNRERDNAYSRRYKQARRERSA